MALAVRQHVLKPHSQLSRWSFLAETPKTATSSCTRSHLAVVLVVANLIVVIGIVYVIAPYVIAPSLLLGPRPHQRGNGSALLAHHASTPPRHAGAPAHGAPVPAAATVAIAASPTAKGSAAASSSERAAVTTQAYAGRPSEAHQVLSRPKETAGAFTSWECRGSAANRSCIFRNLYFSTGKFFMFLPKGASTTGLAQGVQLCDRYEARWLPSIRRFADQKALNAHLLWLAKVAEEPSLTLFFEPFAPFNIGHALFDGLYPAFLALLKFGLGGLPFVPLVAADCCREHERSAQKADLAAAVKVKFRLPNESLAWGRLDHRLTREAQANASLNKCAYHQGRDSHAPDLSASSAENEHMCCQKCAEAAGCRASIFFEGMCYLKQGCLQRGPCNYSRPGRVLCEPAVAKIAVRLTGWGDGQVTWIHPEELLQPRSERYMGEGAFHKFGMAGRLLRMDELAHLTQR